MRSKIEVLDCTLRDGGYYVAWDFSLDLARRYLSAVEKAEISRCEIGFRLNPGSKYLGAFAFSKESTLRRLRLQDLPRLGVMVNTADFVSDLQGLGALFVPKEESCLDFVRLATDFKDLEVAFRAGEVLSTLGYEVALNIMQASELSTLKIEAAARRVDKEKQIKWLYLADSLGALTPSRTAEMFSTARDNFEGTLGFHGHDNLGLALANSLSAIESGAEIVDGTIAGMGRGAGNTKTEELLVALRENGSSADLREMDLLSSSEFAALKATHKWGSSIPYGFAAKEGIHPTFVQEMLEGEKFSLSREDVLSALDNLAELDASKFNLALLENAKFEDSDASPEDENGDFEEGFLLDSPVLILGPGQSVMRHSEALLDWINQANATVMSLNLASESLGDLPRSFHIVCHPKKINTLVSKIEQSHATWVVPKNRINSDLRARYGCLPNVLNHPVKVAPSWSFGFAESLASPFNSALALALNLAKFGGSSRVYLAGLDGFEAGDARQTDTSNQIESFVAASSSQVVSITPTTYNIPSQSVYELLA